MNKIFNNWYSVLRLAAIFVALPIASGCISAKSKPVAGATYSSSSTYSGSSATHWTVATGSNLWEIAGNQEVYNMSERWPLLYKSNLDQIEDADLIYPGQVLNIPRDSSYGDISAAVEHARTRGAWAVGTTEIADKQYLDK